MDIQTSAFLTELLVDQIIFRIKYYHPFCFKCPLSIIKEIMSGASGYRLSLCPLRCGCASVNRNSWGGDPESLWANRSAYYPRDQLLFVHYRKVTL